MYHLSDQQIDFIHNDLIARGVEREDLQLNLLDHICCIIENELQHGGDFENFYAATIKRFYKNELREIEEETTLLLTFKHYYAMKKTMIISGIISAIGFTAATFFKFNHWPGAGVMFVLSFAIFALVFLPLMFVLKMRENPDRRNKIILVLAMLLGIAAVLGVLFKVMHWPGASMLMFGSIAGLILIFLPVYFFTGIRNPASKLNTIVTSVLLVGVAGIFMSLVSVRPSWFYHNTYVQADETLRKQVDLISTVAQRTEQNVLNDSAGNKEAPEIVTNAQTIVTISNGIVDKIREQIGGESGKASYGEVSTTDSYYITNLCLFNNDESGNSGEIKKLRAELEKFEAHAVRKGVEFKIIDDNIELPNGKKGPWQVMQFFDNSASVAVRKLMLLQTQVRTAEIDMLEKGKMNLK